MIRRTTIAVGAISLVVLFAGYAQEEQPEEPSWRAPAPGGVSAESTESSSPSLTPFSDALGSSSSPEEATEPKPPSRSLPPSILEPDVDQLGVPTNQGLGLPDFSSAGPWFEAEGLRFRVGPVQIRFDLDVNFGYNDNIFATNEPRVADYITTISPTIMVGIGKFPRLRNLGSVVEEVNYFLLKYTPSFQYFAINRDQSTVNESLGMTGRYAFSRLILDSDFSYIKTSNPSAADVGRQEYSTYGVNLKASYAMTQKTFLQLTLSGNYQEYLEIANSRTTTVSAAPAFGYQYSPRLRLTLGPVAGITYVEGGGEQPFQTVQVGFTFDTLRKLQFRGTLGVQATQFRGNNPSGSEDFTSPVFSLGVTYEIDKTSSATLDLNRSVSTAGTSNGQTYIGTTGTLGYQKRFWNRIQLDLGASLQSFAYQGGDSRTDTYLSFTSKLGYLFWQARCNAYLTYTRTQRFSENTAFEYDANFIGTGIGVQF